MNSNEKGRVVWYEAYYFNLLIDIAQIVVEFSLLPLFSIHLAYLSLNAWNFSIFTHFLALVYRYLSSLRHDGCSLSSGRVAYDCDCAKVGVVAVPTVICCLLIKLLYEGCNELGIALVDSDGVLLPPGRRDGLHLYQIHACIRHFNTLCKFKRTIEQVCLRLVDCRSIVLH